MIVYASITGSEAVKMVTIGNQVKFYDTKNQQWVTMTNTHVCEIDYGKHQARQLRDARVIDLYCDCYPDNDRWLRDMNLAIKQKKEIMFLFGCKPSNNRSMLVYDLSISTALKGGSKVIDIYISLKPPRKKRARLIRDNTTSTISFLQMINV